MPAQPDQARTALRSIVIEQAGRRRESIPGVILAAEAGLILALEKAHAGCGSAVLTAADRDAIDRAVGQWERDGRDKFDGSPGCCRITLATEQATRTVEAGPTSSRALVTSLRAAIAPASATKPLIDEFAASMGWR